MKGRASERAACRALRSRLGAAFTVGPLDIHAHGCDFTVQMGAGARWDVTVQLKASSPKPGSNVEFKGRRDFTGYRALGVSFVILALGSGGRRDRWEFYIFDVRHRTPRALVLAGSDIRTGVGTFRQAHGEFLRDDPGAFLRGVARG